jgi:Asp-tRNA(Asn)/Glu-tRNA(Gln) amidotransferase A subunit family amidase
VVRTMVECGQLISGAAYLRARRLRRELRPLVEAKLAEVDCLLMPSVPDVAPDPSSTGDSIFQSVWALFGLPSISLPSGLSPDRLPRAVMLVAPSYSEDVALRAATWCEAVLDPMPSAC